MQRTIWQSFGADGAGGIGVGAAVVVAAIAAIVLSLVVADPAATLSYLALIVSILAIVFIAGRKFETNTTRLTTLAQRLDSSLESLRDLQWEVNEHEARYRDLLNHQGDVIVRRDNVGRLTFVNDAFCQTFGMERQSALGQVFTLPLLSGEVGSKHADSANTRVSRVVELATAKGPRWFVWEDLALPNVGDEPREIQSVGRDVTEQRASELALAQARDDAMTASNAKSRFLASVSHEIRTPMNGILGMTGLLMDTRLTPEQRTYARAISTSATTLLALIDEVLDFSKIEAGKTDLLEAPFSVADAAQSVIELLGPRGRDKGLEIGWFAAPDVPKTVIGDEIRVRQILMNLVGNAIKFTDEGGVALTLRLAAGSSNDRPVIQMAVRDTGPGVPTPALERIFYEFEQAAQGPDRRHGGTGLGLAITKRLVDAMGGRIEVSSDPGVGATFTVTLPLAVPANSERLGTNWPRPQPGERVLVVLDGIVEPATLGELLDSVGACAVHVVPADAERVASDAAAKGNPFTRALTDKANMAAVAQDVLPHLGSDGALPRALVLLDPAERASIPELRCEGFSGYLIRPVRPLSALTQLFAKDLPNDNAPMNHAARLGLPGPSMVLPDATEPEVKAANGSVRPADELSVLLAEDNDINALLATTVLEKSGAQVVRVRDGGEAIAAARRAQEHEQDFDLVLMDIQMPGVDGVTAAEKIRALYPNGARAGAERPPIVALTANAMPEDQAAYFAAGLDGYLAKPFEPRDLSKLLAQWHACAADRAERTGAGVA